MSDIMDIVQKLIKFKTTADNPKELAKCIKFIEDYFKGCDVIVKRFESNSKPSLIVTFKATKSPELFLSAHCDVVPAEDKEFIPMIKGNRLYGRGSSDDKSSVAIIMQLMKHYSKQQKKPNIGAIFTTDEETGGRDGAGFLLKKQGYSSKFAVVMDGGHNYEIVHREKASLHLKLIAKGKGSHGSTPWAGENAAEKLIEFYLHLKKDFPQTTPKDRWKRTLNLGNIKAGKAANQVPDSAEMLIDTRFVSDKEKSEICENIKQKAKQQGVKLEILSESNIVDTDVSNRYVNALKQSVEKFAKKTSLSSEHGSTDARYFAEKRIPAVLLMPKSGNVHADNEYVEIDSIEMVYKMMTDFIDRNIKFS